MFVETTQITRDPYLELARGHVPFTTSVFKFGRNPDCSTTEEIVWDGGNGYVYPTVAAALDIYSNNVADTNGGAGAWDVIVYGLDENFDLISEFVVLNGTTPTTTAQTFLRVYRMFVLHCGNTAPVGGSNIGTLSVTLTGTSDILAQIQPNVGQTLMTQYTIPRGHKGYVTGVGFSVGQGRSTEFRAKFRNCVDVNCGFSTKYTLDIYQQSVVQSLKVPLEIPEYTDIAMTCIAQGASGGYPASASYGMLLEDLRGTDQASNAVERIQPNTLYIVDKGIFAKSSHDRHILEITGGHADIYATTRTDITDVAQVSQMAPVAPAAYGSYRLDAPCRFVVVPHTANVNVYTNYKRFLLNV